MKNLRHRAAAALDATLEHDGRGPRTYLTRQRVAAALDLDKGLTKKDVEWLESIVQKENAT